MPAPTNTYLTSNIVSMKEDVADALYYVEPMKTPIQTLANRLKADNTLHEWITQTLNAPSPNNATPEGDDAAANAPISGVRRGNYTQILSKVAFVSGTADKVAQYGTKTRMAQQIRDKSRELKRDLEASITANKAKSGVDPRNFAGLPAWLLTNVDFNAAGTPAGANPTGDGTTTRTYSSITLAFTEARLKNVLQLAFNNGANPTTIVLPAQQKQILSAFSGPGTRFVTVDDDVLKTAVAVYESDFGQLKAVPAQNGMINSTDVWILDPDMIGLAYLRPFTTIPLAATGDAQKREMLMEVTLQISNEKAHGLVTDCTA